MHAHQTFLEPEWERWATLADSSFVTLFRDDVLGGGVEMRHDMTDATFSATSQSLAQQGYYPIQLAVTGSGAARRYSLVYAQAENVLPRGNQPHGTNRSAAVDEAMLGIMRNNGMRQGSLAITKGSKLVYARSFTLAESGYRMALNTTRFRVASVSKTLTALLIMKAMDEGLGKAGAFTLVDWSMQELLQLQKLDKNGPAVDPLFFTYTVDQALRAQTRIPRDVDPWKVRDELVRLKYVPASPPPVVTAEQTARYSLTQGLMLNVGYSNTAFLWLGLIVEKLYKKPYMQVLREKILNPLGITRLDEYPAAYASQPLTEAQYEARLLDVVPNVINFSGALVPSPYAGGGPPIWTAAACLTGAPADFAKIAASFSQPGKILSQATIDIMLQRGYGFDGRVGVTPNGHKSGGFGGTCSHLVVARDPASVDDFSFCVAFNRDPYDTSLTAPDGRTFPQNRDAIRNTAPGVWVGVDLFDQVGLPKA